VKFASPYMTLTLWSIYVGLLTDSLSLSLSGSTPLWTLAAFFSFLTDIQSVGLLGRGDQPVARPLPIQTEQHKHIHASSGIRTYDTSVREAKTVHALHREATVIGMTDSNYM
jgi:hypothetical protein